MSDHASIIEHVTEPLNYKDPDNANYKFALSRALKTISTLDPKQKKLLTQYTRLE